MRPEFAGRPATAYCVHGRGLPGARNRPTPGTHVGRAPTTMPVNLAGGQWVIDAAAWPRLRASARGRPPPALCQEPRPPGSVASRPALARSRSARAAALMRACQSSSTAVGTRQPSGRTPNGRMPKRSRTRPRTANRAEGCHPRRAPRRAATPAYCRGRCAWQLRKVVSGRKMRPMYAGDHPTVYSVRSRG